MEPLFDKMWSVLTIGIGGLVSFFMYRQKKMDDAVDKMDSRIDKIEIDQAGYHKSVEYLVKRFDRLESKIDRHFEK